MATDKISKGFLFTWEIENFSLLNLSNGECLQSPKFGMKDLGRAFQLIFFPRGELISDDKHMSCYLFNLSCENITVDYTIQFSTSTATVTHIRYNNTINKMMGKGWNKFAKQKFFLDGINKYTKDVLIIYCRITLKDCDFPTGCNAKTEINADRCLFQWNLSYPESSQWSEFKIVHFPNIPTSIEIFLSAPGDNIEIEFRKETSSVTHYVNCRIALTDQEGTEIVYHKGLHLFDSENNVWKFPSFLKKSLLDEKKDTVLADGIFTLTFEMMVSNGDPLTKLKNYTYDDFDTDNCFMEIDTFSPLRINLQSMLDNNWHTDVKLRNGKSIIPAHKSILAARSPVFMAMFATDMIEKETGIVDIPDLDVDTLKTFLQYLYTGSVESMGYESATKLLLASNKYLVLSLKEECSAFLMSVVTKENVCEILANADMVVDNKLKMFAIDYIMENIESILPSLDWCHLMEKNYKLGIEVLCKVSADLGSRKIKTFK